MFVTIASLPLVLLFVFNASQGTAAANRQLAFHLPGAMELAAVCGPRTTRSSRCSAPSWLEAWCSPRLASPS